MNLQTSFDNRETMDLAMKLVQEHCGRYMKVYANCVDKFPDTWHLDCEVPRVKLAVCADGNPVVVDIKKKCADIYEDYEKCLIRNPIHVQHCTDQLLRFNECAKEVTIKGEMAANEGPSNKVAVKVLKEEVSNEVKKDFEREVEIMSSFDHDNILKLLGIVIHGEYIGLGIKITRMNMLVESNN